VIPFILDRSKVILELYIGDAEQAKAKQAQLCEAINSKLSESMTDQSLRNMLLDYFIQFTDAADEKGKCCL
jgi:cAMP phosphodiesterase